MRRAAKSADERIARSRVAKRSSRKGKVFERAVVHALNDTLTAATGWQFQRTPRSGGWTGASQHAHLRSLRADIVVPLECPFVIECKDREGWTFDYPLTHGLSAWQPIRWYEEALPKARHADKTLILVFARNRMETLAMLQRSDAVALFGVLPRPQLDARVLWLGEFVILPLQVALAQIAAHLRVGVGGSLAEMVDATYEPIP